MSPAETEALEPLIEAGVLAEQVPPRRCAGGRGSVRPLSKGRLRDVAHQLPSPQRRRPGAPPTLHSLRHSFAVGCLLRWYREGLDLGSRLHQLSTFMGHVDPVSTAVYLTITPELFAEANQHYEAFAQAAFLDARP
jgi:integrase